MIGSDNWGRAVQSVISKITMSYVKTDLYVLCVTGQR